MRPRVFVSSPGILSDGQESVCDAWLQSIEGLGCSTHRIQREGYEHLVWPQLDRLISASDGLLALGFQQLTVRDGAWRSGTREEVVGPTVWTSPWLQIEAGMALAVGVPVLAVADCGVSEGLFDRSVWTSHLYGARLDSPDLIPDPWLQAVRRRSQGQRSAA